MLNDVYIVWVSWRNTPENVGHGEALYNIYIILKSYFFLLVIPHIGYTVFDSWQADEQPRPVVDLLCIKCNHPSSLQPQVTFNQLRPSPRT